MTDLHSGLYPEPKKLPFGTGDMEAYNTRTIVKAGIKEAKWRHQQRLDRDLNNNNTKDIF